MNNNFKNKKYILIRSFIHPRLADFYFNYFLLEEKNNNRPKFHVEKISPLLKHSETKVHYVAHATVNNNDHSKDYTDYNPVLSNILVNYKSLMEKLTGTELYPTYSFMRNYIKDMNMALHTDRPACEISATICLGQTKKDSPWPFTIKDSDNNLLNIILLPGDAVVYFGCELEHGRFAINDSSWEENDRLCQLFIHYVQKNGKFADYAYDNVPEGYDIFGNSL